MSALTLPAGFPWQALLAILLGLGLPLGMPPEKEDPAMGHAAPVECLYYASWAGMATPSAASGNRTEQLLAEPELAEFVASLEKAFVSAVVGMQPEEKNPARTARLAKQALLWTRTLVTRPTALFVTKLAPEGNNLAIEAGLVVHAKDAAAELDATLTDLL